MHRPLTPIGFQQIDGGRLTVPPKTSIIKIAALSGDIRWRDDGGDAEELVGHILHPSDAFWYNGDALKLHFYGPVAITYYKVA